MVNKVILIGNTGNDPDTKQLEGNRQVTQISLATSKSWKNKNGEKESQTQWHRLVLWDGLSKVCDKYVSKGDKIYIEGELAYRNYENKEGQKVYITEIVVKDLKMLSNKPTGENNNTPPIPQESSSINSMPQNNDFDDDDDDDLPF